MSAHAGAGGSGQESPPAGELVLEGRITTASNATFLARLDDTLVVYKPISGEKPLWDFPDGCLAHREVAAYLVSEQLGWGLVPRTWLGDGSLGEGMLQLWQEVDPDQDAVGIVDVAALADPDPARSPSGLPWRLVFEGRDDDEQPVALVHEDSTAMRRLALFDVLVNNADRKGAHVLELADGRRIGVDHGLAFHEEPKLRTVLWGWIGEPLDSGELDGVARVRRALDGSLGALLEPLLTATEIAAFADRCDRVLADPRFPEPAGMMPPLPWPLF